jgi:large subunit ribosomal protein L18
MSSTAKKAEARDTRRARIRRKVSGTQQRPRLTVFRSANHIYAQVIDDDAGCTLASASSRGLEIEGHAGNRKAAVEVGKAIAGKAKEAGVSAVVFDRNGYKYHGRIKALADAAREGGLSF